MATYYLDGDYRLHVEQKDGFVPWEDTDGLFDGKTRAYIEGFRIVPAGCQWVRDDGRVFEGFMLAAAVDYQTLAKAQAEIEAARADAIAAEAAYIEGVNEA